ncbi:hypothetical protein C8R47DRAFT_465853 [Mycena vitilis]|nr:hypothetical protein C8R47DRAFT_465853 [Mycena vitilis]
MLSLVEVQVVVPGWLPHVQPVLSCLAALLLPIRVQTLRVLGLLPSQVGYLPIVCLCRQRSVFHRGQRVRYDRCLQHHQRLQREPSGSGTDYHPHRVVSALAQLSALGCVKHPPAFPQAVWAVAHHRLGGSELPPFVGEVGQPDSSPGDLPHHPLASSDHRWDRGCRWRSSRSLRPTTLLHLYRRSSC